MTADEVNALLDNLRQVAARVMSRSVADDLIRQPSQTADALLLAELFDRLDAELQRTGLLPDAWHPLLKRREPPPRSQR